MKKLFFVSREAVCLVSALLFVFPIIAFYTTAFVAKDPGYAYPLLCWPLALCYISGRLPLNKALRIAIFVASAALAGLAIYLMLPEYGAAQYVFLGFLIVPALLCFILGAQSDTGFPPVFSIAGIIFYLAEIGIFAYSFDFTTAISPLTVCAMAFFLLSLYSFNTAGLYSGVHSAKADRNALLPSGLLGNNMLLLTGFVILSVLISLFQPFRVIMGVVYKGIAAVIRLIGTVVNSGVDEDVTASSPAADDSASTIFDTEAAVDSGNYIWLYVILTILIAIAVIWLMVYILNSFSGSSRGGRKVPGWLKRLFGKKDAAKDYEDQVENLFDLSEFLSDKGDRIKSILRRPRPQTFQDMESDELRVRFAYKSLLKRRGTLSKTPLEMAKSEPPATARLCESYVNIKYAQSPAVTTDGDVARRAMEEMK